MRSLIAARFGRGRRSARSVVRSSPSARGVPLISLPLPWVLDEYFWRCCHTRPVGRIFLCM